VYLVDQGLIDWDGELLFVGRPPSNGAQLVQGDVDSAAPALWLRDAEAYNSALRATRYTTVSSWIVSSCDRDT
jgi:hypothetical protein